MKFIIGAEDYREYLRVGLSQRQERCPGYSLRAFARDLGISPSYLSEVLSGRTKMSRKLADNVIDRLRLQRSVRRHFQYLIRLEWAKNEDECEKVRGEILRLEAEESEYHEFSSDQFKLIADWHHLAVLAASELKDLNGNPERIAESLNLEHKTMVGAIRRLKRLDLLAMPGNCIKVKKKKTRTQRDVPSVAARRFHRQLMNKAADSLDEYPVEDRFASSSLIAIEAERLAEAKEWLIRMRSEFIEKFEDKDQANAIFGVSLAAFPITRLRDDRPSEDSVTPRT